MAAAGGAAVWTGRTGATAEMSTAEMAAAGGAAVWTGRTTGATAEMAKGGEERMGAAGAVKAAAGWTGATADSEVANEGMERMGMVGAESATAEFRNAISLRIGGNPVTLGLRIDVRATPVAMVPQEEMVIPAMVTQEVAMVTQEEMVIP